MRQPELFDQSEGLGSMGLCRMPFTPTFEGFRNAARAVLEAEQPPERIWWVEQGGAESPAPTKRAFHVNREFVDLGRMAALHRARDRWSLLYQILWRLTHGEPHLMALKGEATVAQLVRYEKSVRRDLHKMKAFVRFKSVGAGEDERFVAWFEPEHHIVSAAAEFFRRRFSNMRWSILTPLGCAHWEGTGEVQFTPGLSESSKATDDLDELWQVYYRNIFNPARVKTDAMRSEMPQKYWKHLPEAEVIPALLLNADARVNQMLDKVASAAPQLNCGPRPASYDESLRMRSEQASVGVLDRLAAAIMACRDCGAWESATQAVPGEGPVDAKVLVVGEQPGDQEDLQGRPFVGAAGQVLDQALMALGIDRQSLYLTNAVKHFGFKVAGKRRLHERPREGAIHACRGWLMQEISRVDPSVIVCLGVTAANAVLGQRNRLQALRDQTFKLQGRDVIVTTHPAAVLRAANPAAVRAGLLADLARAFALAGQLPDVDSPDVDSPDVESPDADSPDLKR